VSFRLGDFGNSDGVDGVGVDVVPTVLSVLLGILDGFIVSDMLLLLANQEIYVGQRHHGECGEDFSGDVSPLYYNIQCTELDTIYWFHLFVLQENR
jgi:hypothetical protein